jgi:2-hydroxychromene-2-carboxylate isomerase
MAMAHGRRIVHRPILLSVVMPPIVGMAFGERPTMLRNYAMRDALRCAEHLGIPLLREPIHHMGPVELPSGIVIAGQRAISRGEAGDVDALSLGVLQALWRDDLDIADRTVVAALCRDAGFTEPEVLIDEALSESAQAELARNCTEAIVRGVIGAPTYFVDEEPFYGQDRLDYVERALART